MSEPRTIRGRATSAEPWPEWIGPGTGAMKELLRESLKRPSVSGDETDFVRFIEGWARAQGFETDLWETDEARLTQYPEQHLKHIPLAGRPTLVVRLPGRGAGRSLLFNAHADVVAPGEPQTWRLGPWSGAEEAGRFYGRGACDAKGPLIAGLWAMVALRQARPEGPAGEVLLELVPGEEDCVGLGTLTSLVRGWRADAMVVLEPTLGTPYAASRAGCRFEIVCHGRAIHGTIKWLGVDAINLMRAVLDALKRLELRWNDRAADARFNEYPIMRPVTVDSVHGGGWQGMVCARCACTGYFELLPGDDLKAWEARLEQELRGELTGVLPEPQSLELRFSEEYPGHSVPDDDPVSRLALEIMKKYNSQPRGGEPRLGALNSGCEAGLRAGLQGTPTLVWGPGNLIQAHAADEFVEFADVQRTATMLAEFAARWTDEREFA